MQAVVSRLCLIRYADHTSTNGIASGAFEEGLDISWPDCTMLLCATLRVAHLHLGEVQLGINCLRPCLLLQSKQH